MSKRSAEFKGRFRGRSVRVEPSGLRAGGVWFSFIVPGEPEIDRQGISLPPATVKRLAAALLRLNARRTP